MIVGTVFGFWFLVFVYNTASPVVGTLLPAKTWAESHSTLCFHRDSKVSIDSSERLRSKTIINKIGDNIRTYPAMQPQAAKFEASAALAGADSRSLALLTLRVSFRLPHLSIHP